MGSEEEKGGGARNVQRNGSGEEPQRESRVRRNTALHAAVAPPGGFAQASAAELRHTQTAPRLELPRALAGPLVSGASAVSSARFAPLLFPLLAAARARLPSQ